jgi:nucleotide-binding universal stress UspA family protein
VKILMCTDGDVHAERAIRFGGNFARSLDANVTILHVLPSSPGENRTEILSGKRSLSEWKAAIPEIGYLEGGARILEEMGLLRFRTKPSANAPYTLREDAHGGLDLHWVGRAARRVRLKLREGDAAEQILVEAQQSHCDLIIIGARGHEGAAPYFAGSTAVRVAEFASCSVLISKNIKEKHHFLICTDGSKQAEQAEILGATIAQALSADVTVLSVSEDEDGLPQAQARARRAEMVLKQLGIKIDVRVLVGRPSEEIIREARDHDVVVMGASGSSAVRRFFLGSVPLKVIEYGECPVLLVREKPE